MPQVITTRRPTGNVIFPHLLKSLKNNRKLHSIRRGQETPLIILRIFSIFQKDLGLDSEAQAMFLSDEVS